MFNELDELLKQKAALQCRIEVALAHLPQVVTPDLTEFERCRYVGMTPEGLVCKLSSLGIVYDVWHDRRYYGRFAEADALEVLHLATADRVHA